MNLNLCLSGPTLWSCNCLSSFVPQTQFYFHLFLGPDCVLPSHSASLSYHYHSHYPQNPPASPALLVHTECPQDYPLNDTIHPSVLHMPHHLGTSPLSASVLVYCQLSMFSLFFLNWLWLHVSIFLISQIAGAVLTTLFDTWINFFVSP